MPRFFDVGILSDDEIEKECECNGGISNQSRYNDYRNRLPFHYIEDGETDGYYYWTFGATMELCIELSNEIACGEDYCNTSIEVDSELSDTSINPVENRVITAALNSKIDLNTEKTLLDQAYVKSSEGTLKMADISEDPLNMAIARYDLFGRLKVNEAVLPNQVVNLGQMDKAIEKAVDEHESTINIENSSGVYSLRQKYKVDNLDYGAVASGENAAAFGGKRYNKLTDANRTPTSAEGNQSFAAGASSHAYGDYAIAMAKDNKSYQAASFTVGGGNQTGRTEAEFNDFYWDSVNNVGLHGGSKDANGNVIDAYGDTYADSYSFGGTFGEVNVNRGRDSIVGGIGNKVDALQSVVAGDRNVSITGAKHIVAGFNNTVTDANNTVNGDSNTVAGPDNIIGGYKNNVNGLANTINGANNTAEGDYNLIEGQANITASRSSTIVGYKNAIGYTRDDNLSNAQKTALEVRDEFVAGAGNTASHGNGGLIGLGLKTGKNEQVAVGTANEGKSGTVFEVGNGSYTQDASGAIHITNRKNAFEVLEDGRAKVQTAPKDNDDIVRLEEVKDLDNVYVRRYKAAVINERRAYIVKPDGYDYTLPIHTTALGDDLPIRTSTGQLKANDGIEDSDLVTVKQLTNTNKTLQDNIDKKIDLVEGNTAIALKNNSTISYTSSATASTIMQRDSNGRVKVEDGIDNKDAVNKGQLDTKLDLTGGTLTGDLTIQDANVEITKTSDGKGNLTVGGNLRVNGTTTTVDTETLSVKDNLIVTNSNNTELVNLSGLAIKTGNKDADENAIAYGILYDPATSADSVKLGLGSINKTTNEFTFKTAADANPVATRDDSTKLTDNHLLVWNSAKHTLIDANNLVNSITPASLGLNNFILDGGEIVA